MSAPDVAPPIAVPIQELPATERELPEAEVPVTGPDGRNTGEPVAGGQPKRETGESCEEQENSGVVENNDSTKDGIKIDLKLGDTEQNDSKDSEFPEDNMTDSKMPGVGSSPQKGPSKVTEFKLPDRTEKDSGRGDDVSADGHVIDIVKQSKLTGSYKKTPSEMGDFQEFPQSRPITETSFRDGTKMSYDTELDTSRDMRKQSRMDSERDSSKTPFSVTIERKPLHTAQTRSHSDYYSKTPTTNRYPNLGSAIGQFYVEPNAKENRFPTQMPRMRRPPKLVRLATVTMSAKTKPVPRAPSLYYEEPKKPQKLITWDEAMDSRPPLRVDMEGPGPTQYSPRNKPLNETNSPAWTFGSRTFIEKGGGSRTSWEKTWFQTPEVWTSKVDFNNDSAWPTPNHYRSRPLLGPKQRTMTEFPSFSIGTRKEMSLNKPGSDKEPSPGDYDKNNADKLVLKTSPSFTHQFRREGTVMWSSREKGPGPGTYTPNYSYNKSHRPAFTIRSLRREKSHVLGPFSTM